jgi:ribosome biogenesis ATPase
MLYVPLPSPEGRVSILDALTRKTPLGDDVVLNEIGRHPSTDGFSGADMAALVREACVVALKVIADSNV